MKTSRFVAAFVLTFVLAIPESGLAAPVPYLFTPIADTSGPFQQVGQFSSINDSGTVAFKADLRTGGGGIFAGTGDAIITIANTQAFGAEFGATWINETGMVVFRDVLVTGANGVFAGSGGPITTIGLGSFLSFPSINNQGVVALTRGDGNAVFVGSGGPLTPIAVSGGTFRGFSDPAINSAGTVVFPAGLTDGTNAIFVGNGGPLTLIAGTSGPFASFGGFPVISDAGTVGFLGRLDTGITGIFETAGASFTTVVDTTGPYSELDLFSINNQGAVAFQAVLDNGAKGIFTGPDPVSDKVVAVGDLLFGSAVLDVSFYRAGLNNHGQLAFRALLADGRQVIVRADPLAAAIAALIQQVENLGLKTGTEHSLVTKLNAAERSITRGNAHSAAGQLNAFVNETSAMQRSGRLELAVADSLIAVARAILNAL
jgi:hypothetical protein